MNRDHRIIEDNINLLRQGSDLIRELGASLYANGKPPLLQNGVGSHFRHCIDFYHCFLTSFAVGNINYALRERDRLVETDGSVAIVKIAPIIKGLRRLSPAGLGKPVQVIVEDSSGHFDPAAWSDSTVMRELQSLPSHTTHHYAIIALALRFQGFNPSEEFGVAKSTSGYWRKAV
jgi:hypothetical protein